LGKIINIISCIYYNTLDDDDEHRVYSVKHNGKNKRRENCKVKRIDKKLIRRVIRLLIKNRQILMTLMGLDM